MPLNGLDNKPVLLSGIRSRSETNFPKTRFSETTTEVAEKCDFADTRFKRAVIALAKPNMEAPLRYRLP